MAEIEEKDKIRELIDSSEIVIPDELKGDIEFFYSLKDTYQYVDHERDDLVAKLFLANIQSFSESKYWEGFDLVNADRFQMFDYIVGRSDFVYEDCKMELRTHYLVYLIRNKLNGKLYVGQHVTDDLDDGYMGSGIKLNAAKKKYGDDCFERFILYDFHDFKSMNQMEHDIVTDVFWRKADCCYNLHEGGSCAPNSSFQKEMHRLGLWKSFNTGKSVYHDRDGNLKWIADGEDIPEGFEKGACMDDDDISYHKELDSLMNELHSLGSTRAWHVGDSTKMIRNWIEQQKKVNAVEDEKRKLWREIFDYYRENGQMNTLEKYNKVENILGMTYMFEKYFKDEYLRFNEDRRRELDTQREMFEKMKTELVSFGFERKWETHNFTTMTRMYNSFKRNKQKIDEKVAEYSAIMEDCKKIGLAEAKKKYKDVNLKQKLERYAPLEFKKFVFETSGEIVDVEENVYAPLFMRHIKKRKAREHSERELNRKRRNYDERVRLFNELWNLGSKMKFDDSTAITMLKRWITSAKNRIEVFERNKAYYRSLYSEIMENGYHSMCEKFGYTGTLGNLRKRFKKYIDEYKKDDF